MSKASELIDILNEGKDGLMYKGFWIDTSGNHSPEGKIVVLTPDVERYFNSLEDAKKFLDDKRQIRSIKRRTGKYSKKNGIPF